MDSHKKFPDYVKYKWATCEEHLPDKFHHATWDDERIKKWAYSIGTYTGEVVDRIFASVRVKEQGYNAAQSVLRLSKAYTPERLEISCDLALEQIRSPRYKNLKAILSSNQDQVFLSKKAETKSKELKQTVQGYVCGSQYYGGGPVYSLLVTLSLAQRRFSVQLVIRRNPVHQLL